MSKALKLIAGLLVSAFCLWITFRGLRLSELRESLAHVNWIWLLPLSVLYTLTYVIRTLRWRILLSPLKWIELSKLFPILVFGFFLNNVLPARAGELARALAAGRLTGVSTGASLGTIAAERLSDIFGLLVLMALASQMLPWHKLPAAQFGTLLIIGLLVMALAVYVFQKHGRSWQNHSQGWVRTTVHFLSQLVAGLIVLRSWKKLGGVAILSVAVWLNETFIVFLLSRIVHINMSYVQSAALEVGLIAGVMIPAAPGYVGTFEFFGKQTLTLLGFSAAASLSFVLVLHGFQLIVGALIGIPSVFKVGLATPETVSTAA